MELDLLCKINQRICLVNMPWDIYNINIRVCVCVYTYMCVCVYQTSIYDFSGSSVVKNLPTSTGDWIHTLGQDDPLEEGMASHSTILHWEIPWTEELGELQSIGSQESQI